MPEDQLRPFIDDLKKVFVAGARQEALKPAPFRTPAPQKTYLFIQYRVANTEKPLFKDDPAMHPLVEGFRDRFLETSSGRRVLNDLERLFYDKKTGRFTSCVHVTIQADKSKDIFSGEVQPGQARAPDYYAFVEVARPRLGPFVDSLEEGRRLGVTAEIRGGWWPAERHPQTNQLIPCAIRFRYVEPASDMAETLHHELLHIWYFHEGSKAKGFFTGHGDVAEQFDCGYEEDFLARVRAMMKDLDGIEAANRVAQP